MNYLFSILVKFKLCEIHMGSYEYYYYTIQHQISQTNSTNHYINLSNKSALLLGIGSIQVTLALRQQHISPDSIIGYEANCLPSVIITHMFIIKNMAPYNKFYTETCMHISLGQIYYSGR